MAQASDRDLLALEPNVFRDVVFQSQTLATGVDGVIAGTTLTSVTADFAAAGVGAGSVVVISGRMSLEVVERQSPTLLTVSLPRAGASDAAIPPAAGLDLTFRAATFAPQIALAEREALRDLGLDASDAELIVGGGMTRLVAMGALQHVFAAAATSVDDSDPYWSRALRWMDERKRELRRVVVELDRDGDGVPEETRRVQPARLVRE